MSDCDFFEDVLFDAFHEKHLPEVAHEDDQRSSANTARSLYIENPNGLFSTSRPQTDDYNNCYGNFETIQNPVNIISDLDKTQLDTVNWSRPVNNPSYVSSEDNDLLASIFEFEAISVYTKQTPNMDGQATAATTASVPLLDITSDMAQYSTASINTLDCQDLDVNKNGEKYYTEFISNVGTERIKLHQDRLNPIMRMGSIQKTINAFPSIETMEASKTANKNVYNQQIPCPGHCDPPEEDQKIPPLLRLHNPGKLCFLISTVNALMNNPVLIRYVDRLWISYQREIKTTHINQNMQLAQNDQQYNSHLRNIFVAFVSLLHETRAQQNDNNIKTGWENSILRACTEYGSPVGNGEQHDADDFLRLFFSALEDVSDFCHSITDFWSTFYFTSKVLIDGEWRIEHEATVMIPSFYTKFEDVVSNKYIGSIKESRHKREYYDPPIVLTAINDRLCLTDAAHFCRYPTEFTIVNPRKVSYHFNSAIIHYGENRNSGHYTSVIRRGNTSCILDDHNIRYFELSAIPDYLNKVHVRSITYISSENGQTVCFPRVTQAITPEILTSYHLSGIRVQNLLEDADFSGSSTNIPKKVDICITQHLRTALEIVHNVLPDQKLNYDSGIYPRRPSARKSPVSLIQGYKDVTDPKQLRGSALLSFRVQRSQIPIYKKMLDEGVKMGYRVAAVYIDDCGVLRFTHRYRIYREAENPEFEHWQDFELKESDLRNVISLHVYPIILAGNLQDTEGRAFWPVDAASPSSNASKVTQVLRLACVLWYNNPGQCLWETLCVFGELYPKRTGNSCKKGSKQSNSLAVDESLLDNEDVQVATNDTTTSSSVSPIMCATIETRNINAHGCQPEYCHRQKTTNKPNKPQKRRASKR